MSNVVTAVVYAAVVVYIAVVWRAGSRARDAVRELKSQNALRRAELLEQIASIEAETAALRASNAHKEKVLTVMRLCERKASAGEFASDVFVADLAEESGQSLEVVFEALDELYKQCPADARDTFFGRF